MGQERAAAAELAVDCGAAVVFAAIVAIILAMSGGDLWFSSVGACVSFAACIYGLRSIAPAPQSFALADIEAAEIEAEVVDELVLRSEDEFEPPQPAAAEEPMVLDDILAELGPDARVVRLFDPAAMPTPAQMRAKIDRHLQDKNSAAPPDASSQLFEALAELRRSIA